MANEHNNLSPAQLASIFDEIHTERLLLRRPLAEDAVAMFAIHGDPATHKYAPNGPDPDFATSEKELHDWMQQWQDEGYGYWAVTVPTTNQIIGFGGVRRLRRYERDVLNLYYRFTPSTWGHGYATEMAVKAVALARKYLPHLPVIARVRPGNLASMRVAEHVGLVRRADLDTEYVVFALGWK
jgi:RimJ/RimL family protein N-acetyltransferase